MSKELLESKINKLEKKQQKLLGNLKTLPTKAEVEEGDKKRVINPLLNARKSSRKVRKKLAHLKARLRKEAS